MKLAGAFDGLPRERHSIILLTSMPAGGKNRVHFVEPKKVPRILAAGPTGNSLHPGDPAEKPGLGTLRVCF